MTMKRQTRTAPFEAMLLEKACEIALEGGAVIRRFHERRGRRFAVRTKGELIDLVTEVDQKVDALIGRRIRAAFPGHGIVSEEEAPHSCDERIIWYVDPIDGTTNFVHGYPFFCVSIGIVIDGEIAAGCVYDPIKGEMFTSRRGAGARLNGRRIAVSRRRRLGESLLSTGFPYDIKTTSDNNFEHWKDFALNARALRHDGAAALDLCYVACGRYDGFWEMKLKPWDVAAGMLMVEEAGGRVSDFRGGRTDIFSAELVADNALIHRQMIEILNRSGKGEI
jgi:myo-inositol-1(or 4)-monophosphatase